MLRKIIRIDREACDGCGMCVKACHEGAIGLVAGKAALLREDYCDGLGDCLPACPAGAISFEEREAAAYDAAAVQKSQKKEQEPAAASINPGICPGSLARRIERPAAAAPTAAAEAAGAAGELMQWPVQIKLLPVKAPYYQDADLLIAADCTAYAYAAFHAQFIRGRITLVGCPKLDAVNYAEKLTAILRENEVRSVLVTRMQVPCCGGLERAVLAAIAENGKCIPWRIVTIAADGTIVGERKG